MERGIAWSLDGKDDKAVEDMSEAIRLAPSAMSYLDRGVAQSRRKDYSAALADIEIAISLEPKNAYAVRCRGVFWCRQSEYDKAIIDFDKAIRLDPKYADAFACRARPGQQT